MTSHPKAEAVAALAFAITYLSTTYRKKSCSAASATRIYIRCVRPSWDVKDLVALCIYASSIYASKPEASKQAPIVWPLTE